MFQKQLRRSPARHRRLDARIFADLAGAIPRARSRPRAKLGHPLSRGLTAAQAVKDPRSGFYAGADRPRSGGNHFAEI
jgi:hypothetical protein